MVCGGSGGEWTEEVSLMVDAKGFIKKGKKEYWKGFNAEEVIEVLLNTMVDIGVGSTQKADREPANDTYLMLALLWDELMVRL